MASLIRQQIAQQVPGLIVYNPPSRMVQGNSERVTVRISRSLAQDALKTGLQGSGAPQIENIQVGTFMRASLYGDGFDVSSRSDAPQTVPDNGFAEWIFDVLPVGSGNLTLTLAVTIRYKIPGNPDETTDLPVLTRQIAVTVDRWWTLRQFIAVNWQYFLSGIGVVVLGIGGFLLKRWWGGGGRAPDAEGG